MAPKAAASGNTEKKDAMVTTEPAAPADLPETPAEMTPEERSAFASKLVDRFAVWAGGAGLIPVPVAAIAAVGGLQLQMVHRISQVYRGHFTANKGQAAIVALAVPMG